MEPHASTARRFRAARRRRKTASGPCCFEAPTAKVASTHVPRPLGDVWLQCSHGAVTDPGSGPRQAAGPSRLSRRSRDRGRLTGDWRTRSPRAQVVPPISPTDPWGRITREIPGEMPCETRTGRAGAYRPRPDGPGNRQRTGEEPSGASMMAGTGAWMSQDDNTSVFPWLNTHLSLPPAHCH